MRCPEHSTFLSIIHVFTLPGNLALNVRCPPSRVKCKNRSQFDKELQDTYTLGTVMKEAGYHTAAIGKWGLQGGGRREQGPDWPAHPLDRGFDYYLGTIRHSDGHEHYPEEGLYRGSKAVWLNKTDIVRDLDKSYTTDM